MSEKLVQNMTKVKKKGSEELKIAVDDDILKVSPAAYLADFDHDTQDKVVRLFKDKRLKP